MKTLNRSDFIPIRDLFTELDLLPTYQRFPWTICDACSMLTGYAYFSEHLVPSRLGLAYVLLDETNPFAELVIFPVCSLRISLGTFSILLLGRRSAEKKHCWPVNRRPLTCQVTNRSSKWWRTNITVPNVKCPMPTTSVGILFTVSHWFKVIKIKIKKPFFCHFQNGI